MTHHNPTPGAADPLPVGPFALFENPAARRTKPIRPALGVVRAEPVADWTAELRERATVCRVLWKLHPDYRGPGAGQTAGPCPVCKAKSRPGSEARPKPRGPLSYRFGSPRWRCHCCEACGDVVDLVALDRCGAPFGKLSTPERAIVRRWFEGHGFLEAPVAELSPEREEAARVCGEAMGELIRGYTAQPERDPRAVLAIRLLEVDVAVASAIAAWLDGGAPTLGGRVVGVL